MTKRLEGKLAVVTAAAQGIGQGIALAFAAEGARVIGVDLNADRLAGIKNDRIETIALDVTDPEAFGRAISAYSDIGILVNCVGYVDSGTILDTSREALEKSFRINICSAYSAIRGVLPKMLARGGGAIINIASVVSSTKGVPDRFAYGTTKAAMIGLTKSVARDFIGQGIRCNAISPGTVHTPSLEQRLAANGDLETARTQFVARQPMGRFGTTEEIAATAVFLASDEAPFMTGTDIIVDGGMSL